MYSKQGYLHTGLASKGRLSGFGGLSGGVGFSGADVLSGVGGFPVFGGLLRGSGFGGRLIVGTCNFNNEKVKAMIHL